MRTTFKTGLFAYTGAALALMLAACGTSSTPETGASAPGKSVILISPNPVGVNSFLQLGVKGAQAAAKEIGASFKLYESKDPNSIAQNVDAAVRAKPTIIVGISFSFDDIFSTVPKQHPDLQFLEVDSCAKTQAPNLTCVSFKEHEAAYLAGVEAGMLSKSGKIGVVAPLDTPFMHRWIDPFYAGAKSVNPKTAGTTLYVGGNNPFSDPARAKSQTQTMIGQGADVVAASASGGNQGVFEAVAAAGAKSFGVDVNQCAQSPGNIIDNVIKHVDVAESAAIKDIAAGKTGGTKVYGLAEGGVGVNALDGDVASSQCTVASSPEVIAKVKQVRDDIVAGKVTVADPLAG
ncbi:BMP family ABC transporter substrate-binding protein [Planotetraspora sp. A-T 1434]|uniref:BMP family ABC transporter substrate-binding protein n=1 Tax=Planotetraspora sp. A-T 1434 TaxID=2979219 RepID=UPI0021BEFA0F|nr:BMP family ABC transporter substrate-binding protein [Planotetraspora sp. A-T 1434]MCT9930111.1 BMP family ABC transporter substrate-binding protein [Planotetraspora sp. A-T 1434]